MQNLKFGDHGSEFTEFLMNLRLAYASVDFQLSFESWSIDEYFPMFRIIWYSLTTGVRELLRSHLEQEFFMYYSQLFKKIFDYPVRLCQEEHSQRDIVREIARACQDESILCQVPNSNMIPDLEPMEREADRMTVSKSRAPSNTRSLSRSTTFYTK